MPGGGRVVNVSSGMGQLTDMGADLPAYRILKAGLVRSQGSSRASSPAPRIPVNAACPGWVRTDMGGAGATRSVEQGVATTIWLDLPDDGPSGGLFRDKKPNSLVRASGGLRLGNV